MIKIENVEVMGWEAAIRGMRNPMNSWEKSDSFICTEGEMTNDEIDATCGICPKSKNCDIYDTAPHFIIGTNDLDLMRHLAKAGTDHRKFMRMLTVYLDITAPLYWWKEFDTYKVGTVANSCSTMHKIADKEFTMDDFSHEHLLSDSKDVLTIIIQTLNLNRTDFLELKASPGEDPDYVPKDFWWQMIQLLPSSYNQKRTVMLNYEVLANMYKSRRNHKLDEWHTLCDWIETLPYSELITGIEEEKLTINEYRQKSGWNQWVIRSN